MSVMVRLTIGILQVVGGIMGMSAIAVYFYNTHVFSLSTLLFAGLYLLSIFAGTALLRNNRFGGLLSLCVQTAQLPVITTTGCHYLFTSGYAIWCMIGRSGIHITSTLGSDYELSRSATAGTYHFGVNLVAAAAIALLIWVRVAKRTKSVKKDKRRRLAFT